MTYQELRDGQFAFEAFLSPALQGAEACWNVDDAPSYLKKSAPKVMKMTWAMMSKAMANSVKHPWDTRESFENTLSFVAVPMFYAGVLLAESGPGEGIGFYKVEAFGAGYLFGNVGLSGLRKKASQALHWNDEHFIHEISHRMVSAMKRELDFQSACLQALLDEREIYFTNFCRAAYVAGFSFASGISSVLRNFDLDEQCQGDLFAENQSSRTR